MSKNWNIVRKGSNTSFTNSQPPTFKEQTNLGIACCLPPAANCDVYLTSHHQQIIVIQVTVAILRQSGQEALPLTG